jgi:hypothetical protein
MKGMSPYSVGRVVSAALDPVLVPAGFAAGQYGDYGKGGDDRYTGSQIIFCAAHDEISDLHPWLPQANSQERGVGACVDLVVDINDRSRVEFIDLEGLSLEETLRRVGRAADADALARVDGQAFDDALPVVTAVLTRLFATPH